MTLTRFNLLHRRFTKLVGTDLAGLAPGVIPTLLRDTDAYLAAPREPELGPDHTPFFLASTLRSAALRILAAAGDLPWRGELAAFIDRLPLEEELPNGARFSSDLVSIHARFWAEALAPLVGKPALNGLEVGSFEGRSCFWFLDNVLTHPTCRMWCIDSFDFSGQGRAYNNPGSNLQDRFDHNVAAAGRTAQVKKIFGRSQEQLRQLPLDTFDMAYIDGSHRMADVLEDVVLTWRLLRAGAVLILDDYKQRVPPDHIPGVAIDAFMTCFAGAFTELHRGHQMILRKN